MQASGVTPTTRNVAAKLNASGRFAKISYGTIQRWKKRGWTPSKGKPRAPAIETAAAKLDAAVPVLTGDPTTSIEDIAGKPSAPSGDGEAVSPTGERGPQDIQAERDELSKLSDDDLMRLAAREAYITGIMVQRQSQRDLAAATEKPAEFGGLQQALAGSLVAATGNMVTVFDFRDRNMKTIPHMPAEQEGNPFDDVMKSIKQAEDEHG